MKRWSSKYNVNGQRSWRVGFLRAKLGMGAKRLYNVK